MKNNNQKTELEKATGLMLEIANAQRVKQQEE